MIFPPDIFNKYGTEISVTSRQNVKPFKAFVNPLRRRFQNYYVPRRHLAGVYTKDKYLLVAPPDTEIQLGDTLLSGGIQYTVLSTESYIVREDVLYVWAVLTAHTEQGEDDFYD